MSRHGVFMLDGDPLRTPAGPSEVALDLLTSGMWIGHVGFWLVFLLIGAGLGAAVRGRRAVRSSVG